MIKSFRHKGLEGLFTKNQTVGLRGSMLPGYGQSGIDA